MNTADAPGELNHPSWCEPSECAAGPPSQFHPETPPPAHWGRRWTCNPEPGNYQTHVTIQLVRFADDPPATDFLRVELGNFDETRSHYLRLVQGAELRDALTALLQEARSNQREAAAVPGTVHDAVTAPAS